MRGVSLLKSIEDFIGKVHCGDSIQVMKEMPPESVDMVMFSPPYYGLRNYGVQTETIWSGDPNCKHEWIEHEKPKERGGLGHNTWERPSRLVSAKIYPQISNFCVKCGAWRGQLGLEPSWQMYVEHMVVVCREIKRVLKKTGSMYIVIGDTYAGSLCGYGAKRKSAAGFQDVTRGFYASSSQLPPMAKAIGYKPKCLMGIPWRVAFALIEEDGWILRNDIIWYKPNSMPSSVKDRLTQTYEHIFHFVKSRKYYYDLDAIREPHKTAFAPFNLRVRDVKRGKGGISVFGGLKASREEVENYIYPEDLIKVKSEFKELTKHDKAVDRTGNLAYLDPLHTKAYNVKGKNPGDIVHSDSKFLKFDVRTASPGGRSVRMALEGKLTTFVKERILDVGAYLKGKLKESGYRTEQLAEIIGVKKTTLDHYFRTDFTGQAIPPRQIWDALKPLLGLAEYDKYINEEIRNALPQPHPLGKNPGDVFQTKKEPYVGNNPHRMRLKRGEYLAIDPLKPMDLSHPKGKNPGDVISKRVRANLEHFVPKGSGGHYTYGGIDSQNGKHTHPLGKNPGDFWSISTKPFKGAHFAVYPEEICVNPIKASCPPKNGLVLDPMCGSGTTLVVAQRLGRRWIGIDLNPAYCEIAKNRLRKLSQKITSFEGEK